MFSLPYPSPEDDLSGGIGVPPFTATLTTTSSLAPLEILKMAVPHNEELASELGKEFANTVLVEGKAAIAKACGKLAQNLTSETNLTPGLAELIAALFCDTFTAKEPELATSSKSITTPDKLKSEDYRDWIDENGVYVIPDGTMNLNPLHYPAILKSWWEAFDFESDNNPSIYRRLPQVGIEQDKQEDGSFTEDCLKATFHYWIETYEERKTDYDEALAILKNLKPFIPEIQSLKDKYDLMLSNFEEVAEFQRFFHIKYEWPTPPQPYPSRKSLTSESISEIEQKITNEITRVNEEINKNEQEILSGDTHEAYKKSVRLNKDLEYFKDNLRVINNLHYWWQETREAAIDFMTQYLEYESFGVFEKINKS